MRSRLSGGVNDGSVSHMHALIIEDEFLTAQLIEDQLRDLGFTSFAFAMDEEEAISAAHERCPDLITSDVQLASGCGIDAVQRICDQNPIPILYITGTAMLVRERCPSAVVIQKPFGVADLRNAVTEARRAA
jgi:CheY-like chemotaxis protein